MRRAASQRLLVPPGFRRGVAALIVAVAGPFAARNVAMTQPMMRFPSLAFLVIIVGATLLGRLGTGLIAIVESVVLLDYDFLGPSHSLRLNGAQDLGALAAFGLISLGFTEILARRDRAIGRMEEDRERFAFLSRASDALGGTLDYETRLQEVSQLAVPRLADWCAVHVRDDGELRTVSVAHSDPEMVRLAEELQGRYPPVPDAATGAPNVIRTGTSELYRRIPRKAIRRAAQDAEHRKMLERLGLRSALVVPIRTPDRVIGAISLMSQRRRYGADDLALAEELGRRAGAAIENARLYRERDHIAATLQRALLPADLPDVPGCELRAFYRAAVEEQEVGGDFYDVFPLAGGAWLMVIGDVRGKGAEAAALTGLVRHTIRALAVREPSPAALLTALNATLLEAAPGEQFSTAALVRAEPMRGGARVTVSVGGHPRPVIVRLDGTIEPIGDFGLIVGAFPEAAYTETAARVNAGETLLLYTDGLTAKDEGDAFSEGSDLSRRVASLAGREGATILEAIQSHVHDRGERDPKDDVAVLALRPIPPRRAARVSSGSAPAQ